MALWPVAGSRVASPFANPPDPGMPTPRAEAGEVRTLVVGRGITMQGTVQNAERLVVEGTFEANSLHANQLLVASGGLLTGVAEVDEAEIAGTLDGTLTARNMLLIRSSGRILGTARCRRLQVDEGGEITGQMEMTTRPTRHDPIPRPSSENS